MYKNLLLLSAMFLLPLSVVANDNPTISVELYQLKNTDSNMKCPYSSKVIVNSGDNGLLNASRMGSNKDGKTLFECVMSQKELKQLMKKLNDSNLLVNAKLQLSKTSATFLSLMNKSEYVEKIWRDGKGLPMQTKLNMAKSGVFIAFERSSLFTRPAISINFNLIRHDGEKVVDKNYNLLLRKPNLYRWISAFKIPEKGIWATSGMDDGGKQYVLIVTNDN